MFLISCPREVTAPSVQSTGNYGDFTFLIVLTSCAQSGLWNSALMNHSYSVCACNLKLASSLYSHTQHVVFWVIRATKLINASVIWRGQFRSLLRRCFDDVTKQTAWHHGQTLWSQVDERCNLLCISDGGFKKSTWVSTLVLQPLYLHVDPAWAVQEQRGDWCLC